jgi:leader peptidase (prepilin peptidase)/N-methyltransferase
MSEHLVPVLVIASLACGLFVGSFLHQVAAREVVSASAGSHGEPTRRDGSLRPRLGVPLLSGLGRAGPRASGDSGSTCRRPLVVALTGVAFGVIVWWFLRTATVGAPSAAERWALGIVIVAFLYFAAISILLVLVDVDTHRLPNRIVGPSYLIAGVLLTAATALTGRWPDMWRAAVGMGALYTFYLLLRMVRASGMGGGDVKLAGVLGIYLGWLGWEEFVVGASAAFVLGGMYGLLLMVLGRAGRKTAIPFGPWMILGAWTGIFVGDAATAWYVNLLVGG